MFTKYHLVGISLSSGEKMSLKICTSRVYFTATEVSKFLCYPYVPFQRSCVTHKHATQHLTFENIYMYILINAKYLLDSSTFSYLPISPKL